MPADVYFGSADAPPANWRAGATESDENDDEEPSEEERAAVTALLGFDPKDVDGPD